MPYYAGLFYIKIYSYFLLNTLIASVMKKFTLPDKVPSGLASRWENCPHLPDAYPDSLLKAVRVRQQVPAEKMAKDEDFWNSVRKMFNPHPKLIHLNHGGVSPQPKSVQEAEFALTRFINRAPSYQMWYELEDKREMVRRELAALAQADPEEIAIVRNTTEAMNTLVHGLKLTKGSGVLLSEQDYPNVIEAWKVREKRDGLHLKWLSLPARTDNDDELVQRYADALTDDIQVLNLTWVVNWTGRIQPIREIIGIAQERGVIVFLDGAHAFIQLDTPLEELGAEGFSTSLHKWLCAPFGTGMLHVRKDMIPKLHPIFQQKETQETDIRRFEGQGTRNYAAELAILHSIDFHNLLGQEWKAARLRYLKNYWLEKAAEMPGYTATTPLAEEQSCGLGHIQLEHGDPKALEEFLLTRYNIHCVAVEWANVSGLRVTPHIFTLRRELDILLKGLQEWSKKNFTA